MSLIDSYSEWTLRECPATLPTTSFQFRADSEAPADGGAHVYLSCFTNVQSVEVRGHSEPIMNNGAVQLMEILSQSCRVCVCVRARANIFLLKNLPCLSAALMVLTQAAELLVHSV